MTVVAIRCINCNEPTGGVVNEGGRIPRGEDMCAGCRITYSDIDDPQEFRATTRRAMRTEVEEPLIRTRRATPLDIMETALPDEAEEPEPERRYNECTYCGTQGDWQGRVVYNARIVDGDPYSPMYIEAGSREATEVYCRNCDEPANDDQYNI